MVAESRGRGKHPSRCVPLTIGGDSGVVVVDDTMGLDLLPSKATLASQRRRDKFERGSAVVMMVAAVGLATVAPTDHAVLDEFFGRTSAMILTPCADSSLLTKLLTASLTA